ncbi:hypothetical protein IMZ48_10520, partial [Candidatus Bathyarchaeota archaeon]|nr:hypothetical protein [Candidatus Bathyarchaeota archaeon]
MRLLAQAPEIRTMYNMPLPVSTIRTRMRQEFEKHRYVNKLPVVDVLLLKNNTEYQVRPTMPADRTYPPRQAGRGSEGGTSRLLTWLRKLQETMNFWKQMTHVMSYFKEENFRGDKRLPSSFMEGFLEVSRTLRTTEMYVGANVVLL